MNHSVPIAQSAPISIIEWRMTRMRIILLSGWLVPGHANFEPYGISPVGLSFTRADQEIAYQTFILKITISHIRFALVAAMVLIALFGIIDPFIYQGSSLRYALLIRVLVLFPAPLLIFVITFHPQYPRFAAMAGSAGILLVGCAFYLINMQTSNALVLIYIHSQFMPFSLADLCNRNIIA
jgi:hypothetical protein